MILPWWVWVVLIVFVQGINIVVEFFVGWLMYEMGSGNWGGGKEVIDFEPYYAGGEVNKFRIVKQGPLYINPGPGDEAIVVRNIGFIKQEHKRVKAGDMIPVGDLFFHHRKGIEKAFDVYIDDKNAEIKHLQNTLSYAFNELSKEVHNKEELQDRHAKVLQDISKAVAGFHKPDARKPVGR